MSVNLAKEQLILSHQVCLSNAVIYRNELANAKTPEDSATALGLLTQENENAENFKHAYEWLELVDKGLKTPLEPAMHILKLMIETSQVELTGFRAAGDTVNAKLCLECINSYRTALNLLIQGGVVTDAGAKAN